RDVHVPPGRPSARVADLPPGRLDRADRPGAHRHRLRPRPGGQPVPGRRLPLRRAAAARPRDQRARHPADDLPQHGVPARARRLPQGRLMRPAEQVIITTAVTGSVNVPSQSPYLPLSAEQVVQASLEAAAAGSAIIHLHARHPDGRPAWQAEIYEEIVPRILEQTDVVINITTGGSSQMTMDERLAGAMRFKPELASMNMGSMNFVYAGIADKVTEWKHEWEKPYVLGTYSHPFINTFDRIEHTIRELGHGHGTRFEFECYD